ncbi:MAG: hypothetical protein OEW75_16950 [Cyclobacteriaceae bacterium]|nr:hypothetical protein [Cyclobacteriaceae bacterium]
MSKLVNGIIVPESDVIVELVNYIQKKAETDSEFKKKWENEPREVLTHAGLSKPIQNELLIELGDDSVDINEFLGCYGCSGCCCSGCCYSG